MNLIANVVSLAHVKIASTVYGYNSMGVHSPTVGATQGPREIML